MSRPAAVERDFEAFVLPHLGYLYGLAVRLLGQREGAEDLVQDALLRAFRGFPRLRHHERGRLWLTRITTRAYYDRLHLDFLDLFDSEKVIAVLAALPPGYRTALILAYVYGFKAREVAESMRVPLGTVLSMLSRGRRRLERELWQFATTNGLLHREARG
ncbi:MAG: RNA polymerase sigma factor [Armatimonadota bacterium]|nr:RNA polymerase sigma factor [Armatimonadota bacterium]MDR7449089.1 RNA polymerase sigma factor [Armatimonadota bacterium]MDR7459167.1 RNA polymerase sigma factor [Armatimonadota bacterium]MDR7480439.1 RNA polymerase sigma factor [Armatimonadota bacterium]MDR7489766.1 RNA polymerase sigma factor [Armatimonadota bacterium]